MGVALGLQVDRSGCVAVALALRAGAPHLIRATLLPLAAADDPWAAGPYATAFSMPRAASGEAGAEAVAAVAEGRRRQEGMVTAGLAALIAGLEAQEERPARAALLVNRAGWVTDLLDYGLAYPEHAAVADGLARREAMRAACAVVGLGLTELDDKTLEERACATLGRDQAAIDAAVRIMGSVAGKPWRRAQKRAAIAAWCVLAGKSPSA